MKATGIVRRVDDLGRIVIPKEIRRTLPCKKNTSGVKKSLRCFFAVACVQFCNCMIHGFEFIKLKIQ